MTIGLVEVKIENYGKICTNQELIACLSLLRILIQQSLDSGSEQIQILHAVWGWFAMVRTSKSGSDWSFANNF